MAQRLKDLFAEDVPGRIADMIKRVDPDFDRTAFETAALDGFGPLDLTDRARHIAAAMATYLPANRREAIDILIASLGPARDTEDLEGMEAFLYLPHVYFVAQHGLECFETAMNAQYELTRRFTAEFSIRVFLEEDTSATLERLNQWAEDPDPHVRRLVSEGTRPRLPWAPRLRRFIDDPTPVIQLLDKLANDSSPYVRRSVANNLNDISKDHPDLAMATAKRWQASDPPAPRFVLAHGLRSLVKQGHAGALEVLGFTHGSPARIEFGCDPQNVEIGGRVRIEVSVDNPTETPISVLVDLVVHFVKANGSTTPKVFNGAETLLEPGAMATIRKSISLAVHTTRTPYPGTHLVDVMVNGEPRPGGCFEVLAPREP